MRTFEEGSGGGGWARRKGVHGEGFEEGRGVFDGEFRRGVSKRRRASKGRLRRGFEGGFRWGLRREEGEGFTVEGGTGFEGRGDMDLPRQGP